MAGEGDESFQGRFLQFFEDCSETEQAFLAWVFSGELEGDGTEPDVAGFALGSLSSPLQETQMSFNLQYLQLQSQMQHENRSYAAVSNIMASKKRAVDSSLGIIR